MIDWDALHYDPNYNLQGVAANIDDGSDLNIDVTVIHAAEPVDVGNMGIGIPTLRPVVFVRASELRTLEVSPTSLRTAMLTTGDDEWEIESVEPRPGPNGRGSGEYVLVLKDPNL